MRLFVEHIQRETENPTIHVIPFALKSYVTFLSIHPFHDGNGRIGRLLLLVMLWRHGFIPPHFFKFDREYYIDAISRCRWGDPERFMQLCVQQMVDNVADEELDK